MKKENIKLRPEIETDYSSISQMHIENFKHDLESVLIDNLRKLETFKPYYSEVLTLDEKVIGHTMLTPVTISNCDTSFDAIIIGPVSISKSYQGKGYGTIMLKEVLKVLKANGHKIALVYGGDYYKRFGFKKAAYVYRPNPVIGHGILMKKLFFIPTKIRGVIHYPHPFDSLINEWNK